MASWRDEIIEAVKTKAEREAEEQARHRKRVEEALATAESALELARAALAFTRDRLKEKGQPAAIEPHEGGDRLSMGELRLAVGLDRESAILRVTFGDGKPREFDFAKDRHIAPADVEEYVGRRSVELVRAAQKGSPW